MGETVEKENKTAPRRIPLGLEAIGLIPVAVCSAFIPEAAHLAMKLKWVILLGSFLPLVAPFLRIPIQSHHMYRFAAAWFCNSLILTIASILDKKYQNEGITNSEALMTALSNPNIELYGDTTFCFGFLGFFFFFFAFMALFEYSHGNSTLTSSVMTLIFMNLAASLSGNLVVTSLPAALVEFICSLQVLVPITLLSVALTFPDIRPLNTHRWIPLAFITFCIFNSPVCLWEATRTGSGFLVFGLLCAAGYTHTVCTVAYRFSPEIPQSPKGNETIPDKIKKA